MGLKIKVKVTYIIRKKDRLSNHIFLSEKHNINDLN